MARTRVLRMRRSNFPGGSSGESSTPIVVRWEHQSPRVRLSSEFKPAKTSEGRAATLTCSSARSQQLLVHLQQVAVRSGEMDPLHPTVIAVDFVRARHLEVALAAPEQSRPAA
jgi:hypothetical protein